MAAPVPDSSGSSAYPLSLFLALALIMLSLWRVESHLVEQQSTPPHGLALSSIEPRHDASLSDRGSASFEDRAFGSWGPIQLESEDKEARRKATVALMVYATGNGIRR